MPHKISKVKEWKEFQFTRISSKILYLHKCKKHVTLGGRYFIGKEKNRTIIFLKGMEDNCYIDFEITYENEITKRALILANNISYSHEEGYFY